MKPAFLKKLLAKGRALPGHKKGQMNGDEKAYAQTLESRLLLGEILWYEFEPWSLVIARPPEAQATRWTPDFAVLLSDATIELVDVKGTRPRDEQAERVKIKAAAEKYWFFQFIVARRQAKNAGGGFKVEAI